jgi:hypothetical protein
MDERRSFERINIPESAGVYAATPQGERLGTIVMLGRGGFLLASRGKFESGKGRDFVIVDQGQGVRTPVRAVARYTSNQGVGFEFEDLKSDAAVEIGVIIGKHQQGQG